MPREYSNIAESTETTSDLTDSATTVEVESTEGWPTPSGADIALGTLGYGSEVVEVFSYTGKTATTLTGVTRGIDGTTAAEWSSGTAVEHALSAGDLNELVDDLAALTTSLADLETLVDTLSDNIDTLSDDIDAITSVGSGTAEGQTLRWNLDEQQWEPTDSLMVGYSGEVIITTSLELANYTFPEPDGSAGQVMTTDGAGVVSWEDAGVSTEEVQDIVGGMATDTTTIDFVYNDGAGTLTADVKDGSLGTGKLSFDPATQAELDALTEVDPGTVEGQLARWNDADQVWEGTSIATVPGNQFEVHADGTYDSLDFTVAPSDEAPSEIVAHAVSPFNEEEATLTVTSGSITGQVVNFDDDSSSLHVSPSSFGAGASNGIDSKTLTITPTSVSIDSQEVVVDDDPRLDDSRTPTGSAGGVLSGTYPNPGFAADMATQAELDALTEVDPGTITGQTLYWNDSTETWEASSQVFNSDGLVELRKINTGTESEVSITGSEGYDNILIKVEDDTGGVGQINTNSTESQTTVYNDDVTVNTNLSVNGFTVTIDGTLAINATDSDVTIGPSLTVTGEIDVDGNSIVNMAGPTAGTDAVNLDYVDDNFAPISHTHAIEDITTDLATQAALDAHTGDTSDAHDASAISYNGASGISATDVEAALDELDSEKATQAALDAHTGDTSDAHDASAISYAGSTNLSATDVEAALDELDTEKAPLARTFNAQTGTTFTPALTDIGVMVTLSNASAITVTLPDDSTVAFPVGTWIDFGWLGVGQPSFVAGGSAALTPTPNPGAKLRVAGSIATALKSAANTWWLFGDLAA